jgi:hypothetical protein
MSKTWNQALLGLLAAVFIVGGYAVAWHAVALLPASVLAVARPVACAVIAVLSAYYVRQYGKRAAAAAKRTALRVGANEARRKFWTFVAIQELLVFPCVGLAFYWSGLTQNVPIKVQLIMYGAIVVLHLVYLVQHRQPDGSIAWK